jgi:hypothetical protein
MQSPLNTSAPSGNRSAMSGGKRPLFPAEGSDHPAPRRHSRAAAQFFWRYCTWSGGRQGTCPGPAPSIPGGRSAVGEIWSNALIFAGRGSRI